MSADILLKIAIALLIGVASARALSFVSQAPVLGYANNYDFIRVSSYFHLWPDPRPRPGEFEPRAQHPEAPIRCYLIDRSITTDIRYPTSDVLFIWLGLSAARASAVVGLKSDCAVDLRSIGVARLAVLLALVISLTILFARESLSAGAGFALFSAVVLGDPSVLLLFNTLYSEFAVLFFALAASGILVLVAATPVHSIWLDVALALALVGLGMARTQYAALPVVLVILLGACGYLVRRTSTRQERRFFWKAISGVGFVALGVGLAQHRIVSADGYMWAMRQATATNTFLGTILPSMTVPKEGAALLGLPEHCERLIGKTWYDDGMQAPACPEVAELSRTSIASLVWHDPALAARLATRASELLQMLIVRSYGQVEGKFFAQADVELLSLSKVTERLPHGIFAILLGTTALLACAALLDVVLWGRHRRRVELFLPVSVLVAFAIEFYAMLAALIGDGFIDFARHALLGQIAFLFVVGAGVFQAARVGRWCLQRMLRHPEVGRIGNVDVRTGG